MTSPPRFPMGKIGNLIHGLKLPNVHGAESGTVAVINVTYKLAANDGMGLKIVVVYRLTFATVIMVPLALILERDKTTEETDAELKGVPKTLNEEPVLAV
ncbi:hypothetical protein QQP08_005828 [Theobroma cacao]|nr:hypothetical protein QQP08_005828 [Theobroma cacao]